MYLILIAWLYVTLMMAIAEATNPVGTVLGGVLTFIFYGLLPMAIVGYILGTPARKRRLKARREKEQQEWLAQQQATAARSYAHVQAMAAVTDIADPHVKVHSSSAATADTPLPQEANPISSSAAPAATCEKPKGAPDQS